MRTCVWEVNGKEEDQGKGACSVTRQGGANENAPHLRKELWGL